MSSLFESLATRWLTPVIKGSDEWMCACPFCGGDDNLQFNVSNGLWLCFRCKEKGTAKKLVTKLGGSYTNPAVGVDHIQKMLDDVKASLQDKQSEEPEYLPESYLARFGGRPHAYWTGKAPGERNLTSTTIREWELGYDALGPRLGGARVGPGVTIPYRDPDGNLLGVIFRRLGDGFPRYLYPRGFDRTGSLFGSWKLDEGDSGASSRRLTVGLVEGSTDALRVRQCGLPALAQYGSSLHPRQVQLLRRLNVAEVILFYDYDVAGRQATQQATEVLDGFIVRTVQWNEGKYCWHKRLCGCDKKHDPMDIAHCPKSKRVRCRCGRIHDVDPGNWRELPDSEVVRMWEESTLIGRPQRRIIRRKRKRNE